MATRGAADRVQVERVGGLAGFGLPGGRLTSRGELVMAELSSADRDAVERLFRDQPRAAAPMPDGFRYRITRQDATHTRTVEVVESDVPAVLRNCVRDELA